MIVVYVKDMVAIESEELSQIVQSLFAFLAHRAFSLASAV